MKKARIEEYCKNQIDLFREYILKKTKQQTIDMVFSPKGALFTHLYSDAMIELTKYGNHEIDIEGIFNNPDSPLRQALKIYKTW